MAERNAAATSDLAEMKGDSDVGDIVMLVT